MQQQPSRWRRATSTERSSATERNPSSARLSSPSCSGDLPLALEEDVACGFRPLLAGTWVDDPRLGHGARGPLVPQAGYGRAPDHGLFISLHKELRILEDKFGRQLRRLQEHSERCTDALLRPLELKVTGLMSRQKALDGQLAEMGGDVRGLREALATHVRGRDTADARLEQWSKNVESELQARFAASKQELSVVVATGLRDAVTRSELLDFTDLLKAELPKLAAGAGPWGAQEDLLRTAEGLRQELRLLGDQAAADGSSSKAGVLWELEKASEASRRGLAELVQRAERGERALDGVKQELLRLQEDVGHLSINATCQRTARSDGAKSSEELRKLSEREGVLPSEEARYFRELAAGAVTSVRRLTAEAADDRRHSEALTARLASAEGRLQALEEQQGGASPVAQPADRDTRRRVAQLLRHAGAKGHAGLGEWLEDLGQRVAVLEATRKLEPKHCVQLHQGEESSRASAATEEPWPMATPRETSSVLSEVAVLADSLASELQVARLATGGGGGPPSVEVQPPQEDDLRGQVAAVWCGLAELADVMSVSCNSLAAASAAGGDKDRPPNSSRSSTSQTRLCRAACADRDNAGSSSRGSSVANQRAAPKRETE